MSEIVPIFAEGIHVMDFQGNVNLVIIFEYRDDNRYYVKLIKKGGSELINELRNAMENMQYFLNEEIIKINDVDARPIVQDVSLSFRGSFERPCLEFYITFEAPLRKGVNRYDNWYEEEIAEYDYEILWIFPEKFKVINYEMSGEGVLMGSENILKVFVKKGTKVGGHEWIEFLKEYNG